MPASTERLVERIRSVEEAISAVEATGGDTSVLKNELLELQRRLQVASEALTEGKRILKG